MGYGQYTSTSLFSIPNQHQQRDHQLPLHDQAQSQPQNFNSSSLTQDAQVQAPIQQQEQRQQVIQGQPQGQLEPQVHQQLQDQHRQLQQLQYLTDLTVPSYHLQQVQQAQSQPPTLGFVRSSAASPLPWDSPTSVFGGGFGAENAQFDAPSAAMNVLAAASMMPGYGQGFGHGRENMLNQQESADLIPPITTLDTMDRSTPGSATSALTPLSTTTASPVAMRSEIGQDAQQKQMLSESEDRQEQEQVRYEPPRVIELVERPQRKSRVKARDRANQQQRSKAQASSKSQTQAKVQVQRQSQNGLHEAHEAQKQSEVQMRRVHAPSTGRTSSRSVSTSPIDTQTQRTPSARQSTNPPALVTTVPPPGQWYGIHALAVASRQRITSGTTPPTSVAKSNTGTNNGQSVQVFKSLVSHSQTKGAKEVAHPYPPRLRQRRTLSGPPALTGTRMDNGHGVVSGLSLSNAPSPTPSLPVPSPASSSPMPAPSLLPDSNPLHPTTRPSTPRYLVRADVHYDIPTNTLTAMLEVPGVPREAIRIALGTDARSGVRMIIVRGRLRRVAFPSPISSSEGANKMDTGNQESEGNDREEKENVGWLMTEEGNEGAGYVVKERKCGDFKRVLVVPPETKTEDIKVSMTNGILFLRYPAGEQSIDDMLRGTQATVPNGNSHTSLVNPSAATMKARQRSQMDQSNDGISNTISKNPASTSVTTTRPALTRYQGQTAAAGCVGGMQINFRVQTSASAPTQTSLTPGPEAGSGTNTVA